MRRNGSWKITVGEWEQAYEWALWFRAVERIEVPPDPLVPGPLDLDDLPRAGTGAVTGAGDGWLAWWHAVVRLPRPGPGTWATTGPPGAEFNPPHFPGLARWPALQATVVARWMEAHQWHTARKLAGVPGLRTAPLRELTVVQAVERELRRPVAPFELEFVVLPVRDDEVRPVAEGRYLVSERVYRGPRWEEILRPLVRRADASWT